MLNRVDDNLEEIVQAASLERIITYDYFLNYCNYFFVGITEITNMINETPPFSSWYVPLNVSIKSQHRKPIQFFFEKEFLLDTSATTCVVVCNRIVFKTQA